ncbi:MAG: hypothetical protein LBM08_15680 [Dysgonamonadaceae bacterium]|nr:hypothetical protein [Dysgonamonadaceae bacterium]
MKMKSKIAAKLALVMFTGVVNFCVFTACKEKDSVQPSLKLNRETIVIEGDTSAIVTFEINSNVDWKVQSYQGWLHVSPETGSGKSVVTITVDENNAGEARTGEAVVIAGNIKQSVSVSQSRTINLALSKKEVELKDLDNGDQVTLTVSSDVEWTLASTADWLTVTPPRGGGGRTVAVTVTAGMNTTSGIRNGEIVVKTATRTATCSVKQLKGADRFSFGSAQVDLSDNGNYRFLRVISSTPWTVTGNDWIQVDPATGIGSQVIKVSASSENTGTSDRTGTLTFSVGGSTREIPVVQGCAGNYWNNKDTIILNKHTVGNGVPLVIIGDGFDRVDNKKGDGIFERVSRELTDCFLKTNPIVKDLANMFDIYAVVAESPETGVLRGTKTVFNAPTGVDFDAAKRFSKEAIPDLPATASWIFVGHGMIGGYAYFGDRDGGGIGVYSTDEGVSTYWMAHEYTGHAFASLADEYVNAGYMGGIPTLIGYQNSYQCMNCSVTTDPEQAPWGRFIGRPDYDEVGFYEGGFYEPKDIWRPEQHSIMVGLPGDGEIYYNAQSRWLIYERIHKVAGIPYTFESFLEFDKDKGYNTKSK